MAVKVSGVDGQVFKRALLGSLTWLAGNHEEVNRLNVFPVPDGDTGTNMLLTLQSAVEDVKESNATEVSKIAKLASHGSLMGARGNSGVILSQIFRGFARAVEGKSSLTPAELAAAFEEAANAAYRAVNKPTEGTILTVAREAGRAAATAASGPDATVPRVIAARAAVLKTPSQLQILRDAGVVDAGGFGLQLILEGMLKTFEESDASFAALTDVKKPAAMPAAQVALDLPEGGWGYCTEFLIEGTNLDTELIRGQIESLGNSVLVVGEPELVKVHVHTDDPTSVINLAGGYGKLLKLNVGDMSTQHRRIVESEGGGGNGVPRPNGVGLAAVVAGRGLVDIFRGLGVDAIIQGGQTMNPSTQDMLTAIESVPYEEVFLLPNNGNVVAAAKQVRGLTSKKVHVIETHSVPQGVSAVVAFRPERPASENLRAMKAEAERVQTIEVTHAVRDTRSNGVKVKKGDVIGLINDRLEFAGDDYAEVVKQALGKLGPDSYELVTVYRGEQASDDEMKKLESEIRSQYPGLEVEVQQGGQHHYPFILSVE